jgi:hypothetical protein
VFKGLVSGDETFACAYGSEEHREGLPEYGLADRSMYKAIAPIRSGVERIFGVGKRSYGLGRARYRGVNWALTIVASRDTDAA